MNDSIIRFFPNSIEIECAADYSIKMFGIKTSLNAIFRNDLFKSKLEPFQKNSNPQDKKRLLKEMYNQMLLTQQNITKIPMKKCKFFLKKDTQSEVTLGKELLFIHSLVYLEKNNVHKKIKKSEFSFIVNFDKHHVYLLTPLSLEVEEGDRFNLVKSPQLCLDLDPKFLLSMSKGQASLSEELLLPDLPFKNLQLSKGISTKLRKKISKRKNLSKN